MVYSAGYDSPFGKITLSSVGENITGLWFVGQKYYGGSLIDEIDKGGKQDLPVFSLAFSWLSRYFAGEKPAISEIPLAPSGSPFRLEVWNILKEIPYGSVTTYGDIAKKMALIMGRQSMSSQAVGGAVGHNPVSVIIPCHRVIGADSSLTGYAAGISVKTALLKLEGAL